MLASDFHPFITALGGVVVAYCTHQLAGRNTEEDAWVVGHVEVDDEAKIIGSLAMASDPMVALIGANEVGLSFGVVGAFTTVDASLVAAVLANL